MFQWNKAEKIVLPVMIALLALLAVGLHFLLKNKHERVRKLPLQLLAFFVFGMELGKQCYYYGNPSFSPNVLPFHFCSTFLLWLPLAQLFGEKVGKIFKPMAFCYSIVVFVMMLAAPHQIIGYSCTNPFANFPHFHTFFFHFALVAYIFFTIALGDYNPKFKDSINVALGIVFYAIYAVPCAYHFKINYANILESGLPIFDKYRLMVGQVAYDITLFALALLAMIAVSLVCTSFYKLATKKKTKKQEKQRSLQKV